MAFKQQTKAETVKPESNLKTDVIKQESESRTVDLINQPQNGPNGLKDAPADGQEDEEKEESDNYIGGTDSDEDQNDKNDNLIVAQYLTESRVRSTFKFTLQNVVMFVDGKHYFLKELKAHIKFWVLRFD